ncbi:uncharacterized protein LOC128961975 [Oppia nitens]|uniref:uncharacterized protein LOC128961975 n=1 Tax=Oppia nitens TaxID=1686743 RepID=UPI0023DB3504|nr:uncharacterized protein LOC128961975 [Oppia nitens]
MMNLCKSGISARTKSLREKFSRNRSYSELSFKDSSTSSTPTGDAPPFRYSVRTHSRGYIPTLPEQGRQNSADAIQVTSIPGEQISNSYNILPEEAYCSALDINSGDDGPRFPWQCDVAIQCELISTNALTAAQPKLAKSGTHASNTSTSLTPDQHSGSHKQGIRFWKSSYILGHNSNVSDDNKKPVPQKKRDHKSVLQRAASFDSRGYSRLVQSSTPNSPTLSSQEVAQTHLYVPQHIQTLTPSHETSNASSLEGTPPLYRRERRQSSGTNSAPNSRSGTPPLTPPYNIYRTGPFSQPVSRKISSEKRRLCFFKKQPSSAPDSFDNDSRPQSPEKHDKPSVEVFTFDTMHRLLDISLRATSESKDMLQKPLLLNIPTAGGLSVSKESVPHGYMSLPSPNVQSEGSDANPVFKRLSALGRKGDGADSEREDETLHDEPPASVLHRRRALVPPKLITDGYESATDDLEPSHRAESTHLLGEPVNPKNRRRSSIVVIPPMQICPGDLLVYSKVLTQRNNLLDNLDGSTQCLTLSEDSSRKGNRFSFLRLFDRSGRGKSDSLCGLEEVLSTLQPSVFNDEQLSKYKGLTWNDFLSKFEERRASGSSMVSGYRLSQPFSESRRSSGQTNLSLPGGNTPTIVTHHPPSPSRKKQLIRTQTFDSTHSSDANDDNQLAISAHSTRSHSCVAPVTIPEIRRLSREPLNQQSIDSQDITESFDSADLIGGSPPHSGLSSARSSIMYSRSEHKRKEALWDLFQSECVFLYDHLMVLKNVFMEPLKKIQVEGYAMFAEPEVLFGNLDELCCVTYAFCKEFLNVMLQYTNCGTDLNPTDVLVRLFQKSSKASSLTQAYHRYTLNYINALNYLETLRRQVEFNEFEKWCNRDSRCKKLQLTDLLVSPVQHIMRVPLILKDIELRTEDLMEKELISSIIESEENSLRELDDKMKWLKNFERLLEIQRNIVWPSVFDLDPKVFIPDFLKGPLSKQPCERLIVSPRRQIILEGPLHILDSGKPIEMYVILFDDMLVITKRKKGLHKKQSTITERWGCGRGSFTGSHEGIFKYVVYKQPLSLDRFYIHDVLAGSEGSTNLKNVFVLVCLNRFQQVITIHTFQSSSESSKIQWLSKLRDTADKWKRTLQNTVFRNQQRLSSGSVSTAASFRDNSSTTHTISTR